MQTERKVCNASAECLFRAECPCCVTRWSDCTRCILLALVCLGGIPPSISLLKQTLPVILSISFALEFSLPPSHYVLIFLRLFSLAFLPCTIYGQLISSLPETGCGPGVIVTGYYSHPSSPSVSPSAKVHPVAPLFAATTIWCNLP